MEALLIAPFDASGEKLREAIQRSLDEFGVKVKLPDFESGVGSAGVITDAIASADFVIADVSRENPNVFYELGYAHALRKNTFLLVSKDASLKFPSDLGGMLYLTYDPQDLEGIGAYLKHRVLRLMQRREAREALA